MQTLIDANYKHSFHRGDVASLVKRLHIFLSKCELPAILTNDDLVGFFTSVPHDRILKAANHVLQRHMAANNVPPNGTFTGQLREQCKDLRVFNGRYRKPAVCSYTIKAEHFVSSCKLALEASHFHVCGILYKQKRGAPIGGPASPALAQLTVAFEEQIWMEAFHVLTTNADVFSQLLALRYVDNRLIIIPNAYTELPWLQILVDEDFYKSPITLEQVGDTHFLGYNIDILTRSVSYMLPSQTWQVRHPDSAGTMQLKLSSMSSRMHIICRGVFPKKAIWPAMLSLAQLYLRAGYPEHQVENITRSTANKFHVLR